MWGFSRQCRVVGLLAAAAVGLALLPRAGAQSGRYDESEPKLTDAKGKQAALEVGKILRNSGPPTDADKRVLDAFFSGYFFPLMTSTRADSLGNLAKARKELFQRYIGSTPSAEARTHLNTLAIKECGKIAFGNYHPACRYNAVLIIGALDDKSERGQAPVVSSTATSALLILAENDEWKGNEIPSSVKVAALVGLQRHAKFGVAPNLAERVAKAALGVIDREEIPDDVTRTVYNWMRVQAAEVLANQFAQGPTPEVTAAFAKLIGDGSIKLPERCQTAALLKQMKFAPGGPEAQILGPALADLAWDVLTDERKAARDYQDELLAGAGGFGPGFGGGFGGPGGGYGRGEFGGGFGGGGIGAPMETGPRYEKRRMLDRIVAVDAGFEAVQAAAPEQLKQRITEMRGVIKTLVAATVARGAIDDDVAAAVLVAARDIKPLVDAWLPAAEEEPAGVAAT